MDRRDTSEASPPPPPWRRGWLWLSSRVEAGWLILFAVLGATLWVFLELADEVLEGDTDGIDRTILLAMRSADASDPLGPAWFEEMARDLTALGGLAVLTLVCIAGASYLVAVRRQHQVPLLLGAVVSGWLASMLLKASFGRPRPDLVPHLTSVYTESFPSGHAMMSAVTYLTLAGLIARHRPRVSSWLLAWASLLTVIIGVTRVYLGVHWPSDVLAGWSIGAAWAALCWGIARWLGRRRAARLGGPSPRASA